MSERFEVVRLTADVVLFGEQDGRWHLLLIERGWDPFAGSWALPGGHVDPGEGFFDAAARELAEETGLGLPSTAVLSGVYGAPGRDPRGRYVTWAYTATVRGLPTPVAADDATAAVWVPLDGLDLSRLAFDHGRIVLGAATCQGIRHAVSGGAS